MALSAVTSCGAPRSCKVGYIRAFLRLQQNFLNGSNFVSYFRAVASASEAEQQGGFGAISETQFLGQVINAYKELAKKRQTRGVHDKKQDGGGISQFGLFAAPNPFSSDGDQLASQTCDDCFDGERPRGS